MLRLTTASGLLICIVAILNGCSGAGTPAVPRDRADLETLATDQMTVLLLLRGWLGVKYQEPTSGTPNIEFEWGDASYRMYGTDSLGHPFDFNGGYDGSGQGTWQTADGQPVSGYWDAPAGDPIMVQNVHYEYPEMVLEFVNTVDFGNLVDGFAPNTWEGTQTMNDGRVVEFRWHSNAADLEIFRLRIPSSNLMFEIKVPVAFVNDYGFWPLPDSQASGKAQGAAGTIVFTLSGRGNVWEQLLFTSGEITGAFRLFDGMAGNGSYERAGTPTGAITWNDSFVARLDLVSLGSVEVTPIAAARDLAIDRWITRIGDLTPMAVW